MGPAATAEIFQRIVSKTKASKDQEHMRICLLNNTIIPDRSKYLLEHGDNPLPYLKKNVRQLMKLRVKALLSLVIQLIILLITCIITIVK